MGNLADHGTERLGDIRRRRPSQRLAGVAIGGALIASLGAATIVQAASGGTAAPAPAIAFQTDASIPTPTSTPAPPDASSIPPRPNVSKTILSPAFQGLSGTDARIARLYAAFYLRDPDPSGFAYWQDRIAAGEWTNDDTAQFFASGPEFVTLYGESLSNVQYITLLYQNTLSRQPDAEGFAFWLDLMENQGWTRGQVALRFSDAPEFRMLTKTS